MEAKYLNQKWTHSFEEDTEDEMVYRPEGYSLAKARGRSQFQIKENGEFIDSRIGRNDVPDAVNGSWKLEGESLVITLEDGTVEAYPVKGLSQDKLVLQKGK